MGLSCYKCRNTDIDIDIVKTDLVKENNGPSKVRYPTQKSINENNKRIQNNEENQNLKKSDCKSNISTSRSTNILYIDEGIIDSGIRE